MERSPPDDKTFYILARCLSGGGHLCLKCEGKFLAHKHPKSANMFSGASRAPTQIETGQGHKGGDYLPRGRGRSRQVYNHHPSPYTYEYSVKPVFCAIL